MTIFKVHTVFLTKHSEVLQDMVELAKKEENTDDVKIDKPLVLQDKARGWEVLLYSFYRE
jgi:hypothetical protein